MRSQSKSNCATRQECIDLVKSGSHAYLNVILLRISDKNEALLLREIVLFLKSQIVIHFILYLKKTEFVAINFIDEEYTATGKCNLALAHQIEAIPGSLAWALPKRSPYTRLFTKGY